MNEGKIDKGRGQGQETCRGQRADTRLNKSGHQEGKMSFLDMLTKIAKSQGGFKRYSGSGCCDVCNADVGPGEAYLVPTKIFYSSAKYKRWLSTDPMSALVGTIGVDAYLAHAKATDTTPYSAVCEKCVELFK